MMLLAERYCPRSLQTGVVRCVAKVAEASAAGTGTVEVLVAHRGLRWVVRQGHHQARPRLARRQRPSRMRLLPLRRLSLPRLWRRSP
jgi:hypothetical protein